MPRALIIGDSFVRRLERNRSGLNLRRWDVQYRGVPGADIGRLWTVIRQHGPRRYDTVVIHVGSNDLCRSNDADAVVQSILDLAMYVLRCWTVRNVVISQVFLRWTNARYPMPFTLTQYNSTVASVNDRLRNRCRELHHVTFWRHRRLRSGSCFCQDGVHLNARGERRLVNSLRGALRLTETDRR